MRNRRLAQAHELPSVLAGATIPLPHCVHRSFSDLPLWLPSMLRRVSGHEFPECDALVVAERVRMLVTRAALLWASHVSKPPRIDAYELAAQWRALPDTLSHVWGGE